MRGQAEEFLAIPVERPGFEAIFACSRQVFDRHTHDAYAFGRIDRGGQRWHSGRGQVEGRAGNVIMSNPGEVHDGSPLHEGGRTWRMLHVDPNTLQAAAAGLGLARPGQYEFVKPVVDDHRLAHVVTRLIAAVTLAHSPALLLDELLLYAVGKLGHVAPPRDSDRPSRIDRARARIDDDPANTHSLADLASDCGLSPWQLLRSFARETGFTPHAYQVQRRIDLARRLIAEGAALADASARSGFADQSHMTRIFRRKYGFSPRAWADQTSRGFGQEARAIPF